MALGQHIGKSMLMAFVLIVGLLLLQAGWWVVFQLNSTAKQTRQFQAHLQHQQAIAHHLLALFEQHESLASSQRPWLLETFPLLDFTPSPESTLGVPTIRSDILEELEQRHHRLIRMFLAEGLFFIVLLLIGAWMLWRTIALGMALTKQQRNFVQAVTHELKSPLASIRLAAETLQLRQFQPERQQLYLQAIAQDVDRLENLIGNMLAVARFEAGQAWLQWQVLDVVALTKTIVEGHYVRALCQQHHLLFHAPPEPQWVALDPHAWTTIVHNLVSNAIKYSQPGTTLTLQIRPDGGQQLLITLQDEGIGLAVADTQRIFERFYRVGDELVRHTTGSGLGLFLVRTLVEQLDGSIVAQSPGLGQGTCMHIRLPLRNSHDNNKETKGPDRRR